MIFLVIFSFFACGLYGAADDAFDQQLAALRMSASPPMAVPVSPHHQKNRRDLGLPVQLEAMVPIVKTLVVEEVKARAQGVKSPERKEAPKEAASPKEPAEEDDIFAFKWN